MSAHVEVNEAAVRSQERTKRWKVGGFIAFVVAVVFLVPFSMAAVSMTCGVSVPDLANQKVPAPILQGDGVAVR